MTGSRFLPPKASRFLQKVATFAHAALRPGRGIATRFLARHRVLQRVVRRIPIVTKFMTFFVPEELKLATPAPVHIGERPVPHAPPAPHIAPVYNARARRRSPRLTL